MTTPTARPWFLYVLHCQSGALYTGISTDVTRRYAQHCAGKGARYTRLNPPTGIALVLEFPDRSSALRAEYAFKQLTAGQKREFLIRHGHSIGREWLDKKMKPVGSMPTSQYKTG